MSLEKQTFWIEEVEEFDQQTFTHAILSRSSIIAISLDLVFVLLKQFGKSDDSTLIGIKDMIHMIKKSIIFFSFYDIDTYFIFIIN